MRTAVNIVGDAVVTCVVAKSEGALDMNAFLGDDDGPPTTAANAGRPAGAMATGIESDSDRH